MGNLTQILSQFEQGNAAAADELLPLVYDELRKLSRRKLADERAGQTLDATALVHEAYVRLVDSESPQRWDSRRHFYAAASEAMRRILIENARRKASIRRGGGRERRQLNEAEISAEEADQELVELDEALGQLSESDPEAAELVKLRFFAGLSMKQAADVLGVSQRTAYYTWAYARSWLRCAMQPE